MNPNSRLFTFTGGQTGAWSVVSIQPVVGDSLPLVPRVEISNGDGPPDAVWTLRGATSNERYVTRPEKTQLVAVQAALGRPEATHCAIIPIRKNADWWNLTQDERRAVFERSQHLPASLKYLPGVARRLHHCRDLSVAEPFDFITLFDYAPADARAFEDLVGELRRTEEWSYVEREVDIRLVRA